MHPAKFAALAFATLGAAAIGLGMLAAARERTSAAASPATAQSTATPAVTHHWVMRQGRAFGYQSALSDNDVAAGLATKALVMVEYNGVVNGDYSFSSTNPVTGNLVVMRCAEPCAFMRVMNYDHRAPETFPVTSGSVMAALVEDAREGYLSR